MTENHTDKPVCSQTELQVLLPDLLSGHLNETDRKRVSSHLTACEHCQAMLRVMQTLSVADASTGESIEDHPSRQQLASFYEDRGGLSALVRGRIESHLSHCQVCNRETEFLRDLERSLLPHGKTGNVSRFWPRLFFTNWLKSPALGYAIALLLLYPAVRWVSHDRLPVDSSQGLVLPDTVFSLKEMQRGNGSTPIVYRGKGQRLVFFRFPFFALPADHKYGFALSRPENDSPSIIASFADFSTTGQITILTDLSEHPDGSYILHLYEVSFVTPGDTVYNDYPFELRTR